MRIIKTLILGMMGFFLIYILTSFVQWQFNAGLWSDGARFFTATLGVVASLLLIGIFDDKSN